MPITMQIDYDVHGKQCFAVNCGDFDVVSSCVSEGAGEILFYKDGRPLDVPDEIVMKDPVEGTELAASYDMSGLPIGRFHVDYTRDYCLEWKNKPLLELKRKKAHMVTYLYLAD